MDNHDTDRPIVETTEATIASVQGAGIRRINQYLVLERIGRGMHGQVRRGRDTTTGQDVVCAISYALGRETTSIPEHKNSYFFATLPRAPRLSRL